MSQTVPADAIATFLGKIPLLKKCNLDELFDLAKNSKQHRFKAGAAILQAGKPAAGLGLVIRGKAAVMVVDAAAGTQTKVETLQPGALFGEVGLLLGSGNPQTVTTEQDSDVLLIPKATLESILAKNPEVSLAIARKVSSRYVQMAIMGASGGATALEAPTTAKPSASDQARGRRPDDEISWVDLGRYNLTPEIVGLIPSRLIQMHRLLPLELRGQILTVGLVNPRSIEAIQDLRRVLHAVDPEVVAISQDDFNQAFVRLKLDSKAQQRPMAAAARGGEIIYAVDQDRDDQKSKLVIGGEVIGMFDQFVAEAMSLGASDIHIEPGSTSVIVRYRVEGSLVDRKEVVAPSYAAPLLGRIKVLAELDITERRKPQDGRIAAQVGRQDLNLRVSTMAVARGEKAVIRLIDPADVMRPLGQIFLNPHLEKPLHNALAQPFGAIIVAGPTGSGKSSTLYSMLNERRSTRPDSAIVTVEDPVEYLLPGITQVPVNPRVGFDFATALYGLMRQDPDVIMIGELRDALSTGIMVEAALTGHLVMSSIHGNNVCAVIQRLQHMGTDPILLSQALTVVVAQRLAKRLCPNCTQDSDISPALLRNLEARGIISRGGATRLPRPVGCEACNNTGYLGRVAIQELLEVDDAIRIALADNVQPVELIATAKKQQRFTSFAQSAAFLMARRAISPGDALLLVAE